MEAILNRLRGHGTVFELLGIGINGNMIYALYILALFTLLFGWVAGVCAAVLYVVGESFAWGKWLGAILRRNKAVDSDEDGLSFPYIHYIANYFIKEDEDYLNYSRLALALRGFVWWMPLLILAGVFGLSWWIVVANSFLLAVSFPVSAELGRIMHFEFSFVESAWERSEFIYGIFQFVCVTWTLIWYS